jgi:TatD DNase family protein
MKIKKETKSDIPWIIHGFHGNQQTALQLMRHNFYFSVGEKLLSDQRKKDILKLLPADRLFLETDDGNSSIRGIYSLAAQILNISHENLIAIVHENFKHLFGFEKLPILI